MLRNLLSFVTRLNHCLLRRLILISISRCLTHMLVLLRCYRALTIVVFALWGSSVRDVGSETFEISIELTSFIVVFKLLLLRLILLTIVPSEVLRFLRYFIVIILPIILNKLLGWRVCRAFSFRNLWWLTCVKEEGRYLIVTTYCLINQGVA